MDCRYSLASGRVANRNDIARRKPCPVECLPKSSRAARSMNHRVDPVAAPVAADPGSAAGTKSHRAPGAEDVAASAGGAETLSNAEFNRVASAQIFRITQVIIILDTG